MEAFLETILSALSNIVPIYYTVFAPLYLGKVDDPLYFSRLDRFAVSTRFDIRRKYTLICELFIIFHKASSCCFSGFLHRPKYFQQKSWRSNYYQSKPTRSHHQYLAAFGAHLRYNDQSWRYSQCDEQHPRFYLFFLWNSVLKLYSLQSYFM